MNSTTCSVQVLQLPKLGTVMFWVKVVLFVCLLVVSYLHNFVLGPRLQAEIRDGREERTRPTLVVVGWTSYTLTLALPLLGVALQRMVS